MPIDASIYNLLDTKGLQSGLAGIGDAYISGKEHKGRLSQLAMETEKFGMEKEKYEREKALIPEQKRQKDMQELSAALSFGIQQKNGISNQDLMNRTYEEAKRRGLQDEDVAKLFSPWSSVVNQTDGVEVANEYAQLANPQEAIKQRLVAINRGSKVGEVSPELRLAKEIESLPEGRMKQELIRQQKLKGLGQPIVVQTDQGLKSLQKGNSSLIDLNATRTGPQDAKMKGLQNKDQTALQITDRATKTLIDEIDKLIGSEDGSRPEHPGLLGSVGYLDSKVPPASKAQADAQALIRGLKSKTSVAGLSEIRQSGTSPGSITEKEWPIFQNYVKTIDDAQSYPQFVEQLKELRQVTKEFNDSAHTNYSSRYEEQQAAPQDRRASDKQKRIKFDAQGNMVQ